MRNEVLSRKITAAGACAFAAEDVFALVSYPPH